MNITISDHHQTLAQKQATAAGCTNVTEYLEIMIERAETQSEDELEIIAAVKEGLADVASGRVRPFRTAFAELAQKYKLPPIPEC
jgi:hypothetical protein